MPEKLFFSTDHLKLIVETTANNGSTISSRPKTDATQDVDDFLNVSDDYFLFYHVSHGLIFALIQTATTGGTRFHDDRPFRGCSGHSFLFFLSFFFWLSALVFLHLTVKA